MVSEQIPHPAKPDTAPRSKGWRACKHTRTRVRQACPSRPPARLPTPTPAILEVADLAQRAEAGTHKGLVQA